MTIGKAGSYYPRGVAETTGLRSVWCGAGCLSAARQCSGQTEPGDKLASAELPPARYMEMEVEELETRLVLPSDTGGEGDIYRSQKMT